MPFYINLFHRYDFSCSRRQRGAALGLLSCHTHIKPPVCARVSRLFFKRDLFLGNMRAESVRRQGLDCGHATAAATRAKRPVLRSVSARAPGKPG